ncbi:hypothetical protein C8R45DRAFT_1114790 [Mycena sanguinolenta]|nr:hypothetical protein C8R45DRAFT_1114790 [Mycena sanguinolenta]
MKAYFSLLIFLKLVVHLPLMVSAYPVGMNLETRTPTHLDQSIKHSEQSEGTGNARRQDITFVEYPGEEEETGNARRWHVPFVAYPGEDDPDKTPRAHEETLG